MLPLYLALKFIYDLKHVIMRLSFWLNSLMLIASIAIISGILFQAGAIAQAPIEPSDWSTLYRQVMNRYPNYEPARQEWLQALDWWGRPEDAIALARPPRAICALLLMHLFGTLTHSQTLFSLRERAFESDRYSAKCFGCLGYSALYTVKRSHWQKTVSLPTLKLSLPQHFLNLCL